jgi:hypothetical protein
MAARPDQLLRNTLGERVHARLGNPAPGTRRRPIQIYREPAGDQGWFGPDSMTWKVHARLGPMLVGGLSALMLQTLHPLVVQGVADHSNYREDPLGRLLRTADFIALTTYGLTTWRLRLCRPCGPSTPGCGERPQGATTTGPPIRGC